MAKKRSDSFWISYSDLLTSLFFIMMALFIICLVKMKMINNEAINARNQAEAEKIEAEEKAKQLERILQLDRQFEELSKSTTLRYVEDKRMFIAKDFENIEIFYPYSNNVSIEYASTIKENLLNRVDSVGYSIEKLIKFLNEKNPDFSYQLVIEGTAAIPWNQLSSNSYNPDNQLMYELSYKRALALYERWLSKGLDLRKYNTEIIIAGSGFNGANRDNKNEDNNKRFFIQIIPKIKRPDNN